MLYKTHLFAFSSDINQCMECASGVFSNAFTCIVINIWVGNFTSEKAGEAGGAGVTGNFQQLVCNEVWRGIPI